MVFISQDESENCISNTEKLEQKKRKTKLKKQTFNEGGPRCHTLNQNEPEYIQGRRKSLKKVTFIGDSDILDDDEK